MIPDKTVVSAEIDDEPVINESTGKASRGSTQLHSMIELWDPYSDISHDGIYGDGSPGDSYIFYLGRDSINFQIYLKNINEDGYLRYCNTTLKTTSSSNKIIDVTDNDYDRTSISPYSSRYFNYIFDTKNSGDMSDYELELVIHYVHISDQGKWTEKTGSIFFYIRLSSRIDTPTSYNGLQLNSIDSKGYLIPLYSGTASKFLTLPDVHSNSGNLEDINFELNLPGFTLSELSSTVDDLSTSTYSNDWPVWFITSSGPNSKEAREYPGTLKVSYTYNSKSVIETNVQAKIEIVPTPIIGLSGQIKESNIGLKSADEYNTNFKIYQGTTSTAFSLKFTNEGNVEIKGLEVELYSNDAAFFFKSNFYYDETNYAYKSSFGDLIEFGDLDVGESSTKSFPTEVIKNLPPGLYKIPIRYTAKYNTGEIYDTDMDIFDFHTDIVMARSVENEGYLPFILVEVLPGEDKNDISEPDLFAKCDTYLQPGMHNVRLDIELTNLENYRLNNVEVELETGGSSPMLQLNDINGTVDKIGPRESEFTLYAGNDPYNSNKNVVTFMVDVKPGVLFGLHDVALTVSCLDPYNQERKNVVYVTININPIPPEFVISDVTATEIIPDSMFTLSVKLYNCGGTNAENVKMMFNGSSTLFSAKEAVQGPQTILKDTEKEFQFLILTEDIEPGGSYSPSILISYDDEMGNHYPFGAESVKSVSLRAEVEEEPKPEERFMDLTLGASLLVLGIFILVSVIIFGSFQFMIARLAYEPEERKEKRKKKDKKSVLTSQPQLKPQPQPMPPPPPDYNPEQYQAGYSNQPPPPQQGGQQYYQQ